MSLEIEGKIVKVLEVETGTSKAGKEWKKQGFVLDTYNQFNPEVCFGVFGEEKIAELAKFKAGDTVKVGFNLSSREFNGKWYSSVDAWKIDSVSATKEPAATEEDDLPF